MECHSGNNCSGLVMMSDRTVCRGDRTCDDATIVCNDLNCEVEIRDKVDRLFINATLATTFNLKCNSKCDGIVVHCPEHVGSSCTCENCNSKITYICHVGGSYCPSYQVKRIQRWRGKVWCKTNKDKYYYSPTHFCPNLNDQVRSCRSIYTNPTTTYLYAPNDKCIAINATYFSPYSNQWYHNVYTYSCMRNQTSFSMPRCVQYVGKQPIDYTRVRWVNQTRWLNRTRWVNETLFETRWVNESRFETRWLNRIRWINRTTLHNDVNNYTPLGGLEIIIFAMFLILACCCCCCLILWRKKGLPKQQQEEVELRAHRVPPIIIRVNSEGKQSVAL